MSSSTSLPGKISYTMQTADATGAPFARITLSDRSHFATGMGNGQKS